MQRRIRNAVEDAIRSKVDFWDWLVAPFGDFDDPLGAAAFTFSHSQVQDTIDRIPFERVWTNAETRAGGWAIRGFVERVSGCCVAASGADAPTVRSLRALRDDLSGRAWGRAAITGYDTLSALAAPLMARSSMLRALTRIGASSAGDLAERYLKRRRRPIVPRRPRKETGDHQPRRDELDGSTAPK